MPPTEKCTLLIERMGDRASGEIGMGSDLGGLVPSTATLVEIVVAGIVCELSSFRICITFVEGLKDASDARVTAEASSLESIAPFDSCLAFFEEESRTANPASRSRLGASSSSTTILM